MSGGSGPCCVMCYSTSRTAEPASSGSVNRLQCESQNILLVTQCAVEEQAKSRCPETLTAIIRRAERRHLHYCASHFNLSLFGICSLFSVSLILSFHQRPFFFWGNSSSNYYTLKKKEERMLDVMIHLFGS